MAALSVSRYVVASLIDDETVSLAKTLIRPQNRLNDKTPAGTAATWMVFRYEIPTWKIPASFVERRCNGCSRIVYVRPPRLRTKKENHRNPNHHTSIPHFYRRPTEITQTDNGPHVYTALHHFFNQSLTIIIAITVIIIFLLLFRFSFSRNGDTRV